MRTPNPIRYDFFKHPAVARVSAWLLVFDGKPAGKIIVAFPNDGAGIVRASVSTFAGPLKDMEWTQGTAGGYGYHKASAAVEDALMRAGIEHEDHFDGRGESEMRRYFESIGYQVWDVL